MSLVNSNSITHNIPYRAKLHIKYDKVTNSIKAKLDSLYNSEANISNLNSSSLEDYIEKNKTKLQSIPVGIYSLTFDKKGIPNNSNFPTLSIVPQKIVGEFKVPLKSKVEMRIEVKDSVLISTNYLSGVTKELFVDKYEKFYFKSKTGLPSANIIYHPEVEKNIVQIVKSYKKEKYVNGILVDTSSFLTRKNVKIIKKDN